MSKNKKQKQDKVYMEIATSMCKEPYFLRVPNNIGPILDKLMGGDDEKSHRNCKSVLKIFCEEFMELDAAEQDKVETLINCRIAQTETIYDLLSLLLQREKYYILSEVDTKKKLGEFHIFAARRNEPSSWIAKKDYSVAKQVGQRIKKLERGVFYGNDYVGMYRCLSETDD